MAARPTKVIIAPIHISTAAAPAMPQIRLHNPNRRGHDIMNYYSSRDSP